MRYSGNAVVEVKKRDDGYQARLFVKGRPGASIQRVTLPIKGPDAETEVARLVIEKAVEDGKLDEDDVSYEDDKLYVGRAPTDASPRAMVMANPIQSEGISTTAMVGLGVGAATIVGLGLFYVFKAQAANKSFGTNATWGPPSFQLTPAARAVITPTPAVVVGQFVALTDIVAGTPIIVQVSAIQAPLATGTIVAVGPGSTMAQGQTATFNIADANASSATLAALAQILFARGGTA